MKAASFESRDWVLYHSYFTKIAAISFYLISWWLFSTMNVSRQDFSHIDFWHEIRHFDQIPLWTLIQHTLSPCLTYSLQPIFRLWYGHAYDHIMTISWPESNREEVGKRRKSTIKKGAKMPLKSARILWNIHKCQENAQFHLTPCQLFYSCSDEEREIRGESCLTKCIRKCIYSSRSALI